MAWRFLFLIGAFVAVPIILMRKNIPESPRWLLLKGKNKEAIEQIEKANRITFTVAYFISALLMITAGIISLLYGVDSEKKSLEDICDE